jgi:AcrR family transcriptional regulator
MRAFGELGYAETRVEDILRAAGISRPTFYKFFRNRDEVFDAIAESEAFSLIQAIRGAVSTDASPLERLDRAMDAYVRWRVATGPVGRVLDAEALRPGSYASQQRQAILDAVMSLFAAGAGEALGGEVDPLLYAGLIAALERIGSTLYEEPRVGEKEIARRKQAMVQLTLGALSWGRDLSVVADRARRPSPPLLDTARDVGSSHKRGPRG